MMSRQAIDKANTDFATAMNQGDVAAAVRVYADDAKLLPPNSPVVIGRANIQDFWKGAAQALGIKHVSMNTVDVEFMDDTAIEHGEYTLELAAAEDKGKFIVVWKRQPDDSWKWQVDIFNSDLPPA
jgi:ketosteroid isomerase-like protein